MAKKDSLERFVDIGVRGIFGTPWQYGERIYGQATYGLEEIEWDQNEYGIPQYGRHIYGTDDKRWGIYQRRKENGQIFYVRERFYTPTNPQTGPQQAWRTTFKNGAIAWQALTPTEKEKYNKKALKYGIYGYNLFMKNWLKTH